MNQNLPPNDEGPSRNSASFAGFTAPGGPLFPVFDNGGIPDDYLNAQQNPFTPFGDLSSTPSHQHQFYAYASPQPIQNTQTIGYHTAHYAAYAQYPAPLLSQNSHPISYQSHTPSPAVLHSSPHPRRTLPVTLHQQNPPNHNAQSTRYPSRASTQDGRQANYDVIAGNDHDSSRSVDLPHRERSEDTREQEDLPVVESAGAASRRRIRRRPAALSATSTPRDLSLSRTHSISNSPSIDSPTSNTHYRFINNDSQDPNKRGKKPPTPDQKQVQETMVEMGGACIWCSEKRKICDLGETCAPCQTAGVRCIRGKGEFYLFKAPAAQPVKKGSYQKALEEARADAFKHICSALRGVASGRDPTSNLTIKLHGGDTRNIVLQVATHPDALANSKSLEISYSDLFDQIHAPRDDFSAKLVQTVQEFVTLAVPSSFDRLEGKEPSNERKLLQLIESATIDMSIIKGLQHAKIHAAADEILIAISLGGLLCGSLVKNLGMTIDDSCGRLRERLRHKKGHYAETRYAIALYYLIVKDLMDLNTDSAIDDILDALRSQLPDVCSTLQSIFEKTQDTLKNERKKIIQALKNRPRSEKEQLEATVDLQFQGMLDIDEDLDTFIANHVPENPSSPDLHFAFYVANRDGLPVSSRASRQFDPFDHRTPWMLGDILRHTVIDPALLPHSSTSIDTSSKMAASVDPKPPLPKIKTSFATEGPSDMPFLTERNLNNLVSGPKRDPAFLSPSTARHAYHASLRTSQAGTAVSSVAETETTFAVSPRVFDETDAIKHEPMTEEEKRLDFDSLHLTQDKPGENSKLSLGVKRSHSPDSEVSPNSTTFPSRKRVEVDDTEIDWDELGWKAEWEAAFGAHDLATQEAAINSNILSSPVFSSRPVQ